jgi:UDP-N-acetylmuramate--alanine ligase
MSQATSPAPAGFAPGTSFFFIGVAGAGMSALAQYLAQRGYPVRGSDRQFGQIPAPISKTQLEAEGIECVPQDGGGITSATGFVITGSAIENGNPDLDRAAELGIPVLHRSELLARLTRERRTIAISGTSGKSSVTGMTWHILEFAGLSPSLLSGAGLSCLEAQGKIGNAVAGKGEWLVCEADESDGTLVRYEPEVGVILNIDKDHKELSELDELFRIFSANTQGPLIVNGDHPLAVKFSKDRLWEFGHEGWQGFQGIDFEPVGTSIRFRLRRQGQLVRVEVPVPGRHNMENALAAIACATAAGVPLKTSAEALKTWGGIHRRHQILGCVQGVTLVDDFAHNPAKIAASIKACQGFTKGRLLSWFQPHGFGPTRFLRKELVAEIQAALRPDDEIYFSRIFYAGGTAVQDISAGDLIDDLKALGCKAYYLPERADAAKEMIRGAFPDDTILLMGARDPSLAEFARATLKQLHFAARCD